MPASDERPYHENFEFHRQRFTRIAETLAEHSIRLGLDFLATPRHREGLQYQFIHSPDALVTLAKTVGMENVGIAVDVWQWQVAGATWEPLRELSANEIVSVRIADVPAEFDPATIADEDRLLASDGGTIDVVSIIKLLAEKGFEGPLTPYPDPSQFNGITRDSLVRQAADSVQLNSLQEESLEEPEAELVASGSEDAESVS